MGSNTGAQRRGCKQRETREEAKPVTQWYQAYINIPRFKDHKHAICVVFYATYGVGRIEFVWYVKPIISRFNLKVIGLMSFRI